MGAPTVCSLDRLMLSVCLRIRCGRLPFFQIRWLESQRAQRAAARERQQTRSTNEESPLPSRAADEQATNTGQQQSDRAGDENESSDGSSHSETG